MNDNVTPISDQSTSPLEELFSAPKPLGTPAVVDGRVIRQLMVSQKGNRVHLQLDGRLGIDIPSELAVDVCWLIANALAIGAGYSHVGAESRAQPFAPVCVQLTRPHDTGEDAK
jgi:hypothetical protein